MSKKKDFNTYWFMDCLEEAIKADDFERVKTIVKNGRSQLGPEPRLVIVQENGTRLSFYP